MSEQIKAIINWTEHGKPIFDCRDNDVYCVKHIKRSVNIPAHALYMRMQEFPDKTQSFIVIADAKTKPKVCEFFQERNLALECILDWEQIDSISELSYEKGSSNHFYWRPSKFIDEFIENELSLTFPDGACVLDLACGSGRDATYLALKGHQVYGVDYSTTALTRAQLTSHYHGVDLALEEINLESSSVDLPDSFPRSFDAIVVCRYLHRPLFPIIKNWLSKGGLIAYQTFMQGAEQFGSPKNPNFLLKTGELASTFQGFSVLRDEIHYLDDGRPISAFIAKKT
ncbi:MAG: methyltransferase domain-containing protein [Gammaproteobacteria bacterium]|nr:methyltransferase domain-containing protein [Gammaproteobacteria bacterium]